MSLNNCKAIGLFVGIELAVEVIADILKQAFNWIQWSSLWFVAQRYELPGIAICVAMMTMIIMVIALLETKHIENLAKVLVRKCVVVLVFLKRKLLRKL